MNQIAYENLLRNYNEDCKKAKMLFIAKGRTTRSNKKNRFYTRSFNG